MTTLKYRIVEHRSGGYFPMVKGWFFWKFLTEAVELRECLFLDEGCYHPNLPRAKNTIEIHQKFRLQQIEENKKPKWKTVANITAGAPD